MFKLYKHGTPEQKEAAKEKLFRSQHNYVCKVAAKFCRRCKHLLYEDLMQEGLLGLLKGIEDFDPAKGIRLSTYATHWIKQHIGRAIIYKDATIRTPCHAFEFANKVRRTEKELERELERMPTEEEVLLKAGIKKANYKSARDVEKVACLTMETIIGRGVDGNPFTLADVLPAPYSSIQDEMDKSSMRRVLTDAMTMLNPNQKHVLKERFGLNKENQSKTLEQIGNDLHLTRERVRQIESKALRRIRNPATLKKLAPLRETCFYA